MSCKITYTGDFLRATKRLAKKYRSLKSDLQKVNDELLENPFLGTEVFENVHKIRFAIKSKNKGKSGGGRILTYVDVEVIRDEDVVEVFMLAIYDKSDLTTIKNHEISSMVKRVIESQEEA